MTLAEARAVFVDVDVAVNVNAAVIVTTPIHVATRTSNTNTTVAITTMVIDHCRNQTGQECCWRFLVGRYSLASTTKHRLPSKL